MNMQQIATVNPARIGRFGSGGAYYRSATPIADADIARIAPSVFAQEKHTSRSERYTYIPTSEVLRGLRNEGFLAYEVRQGGSRDTEKRGFTKHLIKLRREGTVAVGDTVREVLLLNSHDGTSSYQIMSGLFRLVCSNGLVVADGVAETIKIPHKGDVVGRVVDAAYEIIAQGDYIDQSVDHMRHVRLTQPEQNALAEAAATLRFEEGKVPVEPHQINQARRGVFVGHDVWSTFNRVHENLIRGGLDFTRRNLEGQVVANASTRPVHSIESNVSLNKALWLLADRMASIKQAA